VRSDLWASERSGSLISANWRQIVTNKQTPSVKPQQQTPFCENQTLWTTAISHKKRKNTPRNNLFLRFVCYIYFWIFFGGFRILVAFQRSFTWFQSAAKNIESPPKKQKKENKVIANVLRLLSPAFGSLECVRVCACVCAFERRFIKIFIFSFNTLSAALPCGSLFWVGPGPKNIIEKNTNKKIRTCSAQFNWKNNTLKKYINSEVWLTNK